MVLHNQADDSLNTDKSISDIEVYDWDAKSIERLNFDDACEFYRLILVKVSEMIPILYEKGRTEGRSAKEIGERIDQFDIPYRTKLRYTPDWAKRGKGYNNKRNAKVAIQSDITSVKSAKVATQQAKLADVTPIKIPPPEQPIIEEEEAHFNQEVREQVTTQSQPRRHEHCIIPFALAEQLSRFLMSRMIGTARANGDPGVIFKINDRGELYPP